MLGRKPWITVHNGRALPLVGSVDSSFEHFNGRFTLIIAQQPVHAIWP